MENIRLKEIFNLRVHILFVVLISSVQCFCSTQRRIDAVISRIEHKYSIELDYKNIPKISWDSAKYTVVPESDYEQLLKYLRLFRKEFEKYPKDFIEKSKLKGIFFVKTISVKGQDRGAYPDSRKENLYYGFMRGAHNPVYKKHVVHHEFYHMLEEEFNGSPYYKDPNWAALNEKDFKYGKGGASVQHIKGVSKLAHPEKGFINLYSMSGLEEDKAEIYASLFVKSETAKIRRWFRKDPILRKKVKYMKDFLFKQCEDMNARYWASYKVIKDDGNSVETAKKVTQKKIPQKIEN